MNRYDQQRFRESRGGSEHGRDDRGRHEGSREASRGEGEPRRGGFYPAGGYGFNPAEYEVDDTKFVNPDEAENEYRNRDFSRGRASGFDDERGGGYGHGGAPAEGGRSGGGYSGGGYSGRGDFPGSKEYSGHGTQGGGQGSPDRGWGRQQPWRGEQGGGQWQSGRGSGYPVETGYGRGSSGQQFRGGAGSYDSQEQRRYPPGPKGYTRSDDRLREDICERLMASHEIDSSDVTVNVKDGKVSLEGSVPQRWMKHAIEDTADRCAGVKDVDNRINVARAEQSASGAIETTSTAASTTLDSSTTGRPRREN